MWYDVNKTLTHNALINIIIGPRGYGKTYALKKKCVENFVKKGKQFIYLRRYQAELDLVKEGLFNDITVNGEFEHPVEFKYDTYFYNDNVIGYAIALSRANHYKSASFPFVSTIVFDEFIIDPSQNAHYLKNEVRKFLDFMETVGRMREDIQAFLLANSLSFVNPYTLYWDIKQPRNGRISKAVDNLVMLELVGDEEFRERKQQTKFGRLIAGTEFASMSVDNQFILDSDTFIEGKPGTARHSLILEYGGVKYGVWVADGIYYIDTDYDASCKLTYSLSMDDHSPDTTLMLKMSKGAVSIIATAFKHGKVRFSNLQVKSALMEVFRHGV